MGYRITYQPMKKIRNLEKRRSRRLALTGLFLVLFLIFTHVFWQEGRQFLQSLLIPGDAAVTVSAMEDFTHALSSGIPFSEAFAAFCHSILEGASIGPV